MTTNPVAKTLNKMSEVFGLSREEQATVLKVKSRKTLNNWFEGSKPSKKSMSRLYRLEVLMAGWLEDGFSLETSPIRQVTFDGNTILDLLKEDVIDSKQILFAASSLRMVNQTPITIRDPFA